MSKTYTAFTFGFLAGAAVALASLPSTRRAAKKSIETGINDSREKLNRIGEELAAGVESKKKAVSASFEAARSVYKDAVHS